MTGNGTAATGSALASLLNGAAGFGGRAADLLAGCSLTVDRWRILELAMRPGSLTMSGLATALSMPSSTATRIVDHLVDDGLLHRVIDLADRRRVVLKVTDKGRSVVGTAARQLEPLEAEVRALVEGAPAGPGTEAGTDRWAGHLVQPGRTSG